MSEITDDFKPKPSARANARQVGGDHYKTGGIELWDMFGPEAIMFYAVRYVARWRKKDGIKDLEKGKHVVEKLRELGGARRPMLPVDRVHVEAWAKNQGCTWVEQTIIMRIMFWESKADIDEAIRGIEYLIQTTSKTETPVEKKTKELADDAIERLKSLPQNSTHEIERCVPRYDKGDIVPPDALESLVRGEAHVPHPDTGEQKYIGFPPTGIYPWIAKSFDVLAKDGIDTPLLELFWTKRGEYWVLDPHVSSQNAPPRVLRHCYLSIGLPSWVIDVNKIPAAAREYYPSLKEMLNKTEWEELPGWQRTLYIWRPAHSKYELINPLWHVEEPLAAHYKTMETGHG